MPQTNIAALDIGTKKTKIVVGFKDKDRFVVINYAEADTLGMEKGQIVELRQVKETIKSVLAELKDERGHQMRIDSVTVSISTSGLSEELQDSKQPLIGNEAITQRDMDNVVNNAEDLILAEDLMELQTICQSYSLDDQQVAMISPIGMHGKILIAHLLTLVIKKAHYENLQGLISQSSMQLNEVVATPLADATAILTQEDKTHGVVLINYGAGTINYIVYANNILVTVGMIAVGSDHITRDLMHALKTSAKVAENIKLNHGSAIVLSDIANERISIESKFSTQEQTVNKKTVHTVINARVDESLRIIRKKLIDKEAIHNISKVIISGGIRDLPGITTLASNIFGVSCSLAQYALPVSWESVETPKNAFQFTTAIGLLLWKEQQESEIKSNKTFWERWFAWFS